MMGTRGTGALENREGGGEIGGGGGGGVNRECW